LVDKHGAAAARLSNGVSVNVRAKHPILRMVQVYLHWIGRIFIVHDKRHPLAKTAAVASFLSALSVDDHVLPSTQNQAISALLLYLSV